MRLCSGFCAHIKWDDDDDNNNINNNNVLKKNLGTVPGRHSIDSPQKTAVVGTSHIIRKVLQCEA